MLRREAGAKRGIVSSDNSCLPLKKTKKQPKRHKISVQIYPVQNMWHCGKFFDVYWDLLCLRSPHFTRNILFCIHLFANSTSRRLKRSFPEGFKNKAEHVPHSISCIFTASPGNLYVCLHEGTESWSPHNSEWLLAIRGHHSERPLHTEASMICQEITVRPNIRVFGGQGSPPWDSDINCYKIQ